MVNRECSGMEEHYSVNYVPSVWPSSLPMNALNVGHGVCVCVLLPGLLLLTKKILRKFSLGLASLLLFFKTMVPLKKIKRGQQMFSIKYNRKYFRL